VDSGIEIRRTDDRLGAIALGVAAGLDSRGPADEDVLAVWGAYDDGVLVGTVTLGKLYDLVVVSWLAVAEAHRGRGLGRRLLGELEAEARRRSEREVWAPARAPGFFKAQGYHEVVAGTERDRLLGDCLDCEQFGVCRPEVVVKRLSAA
jgi:N-acetylglutamate synthase-like GNAT family acetyltransferase